MLVAVTVLAGLEPAQAASPQDAGDFLCERVVVGACTYSDRATRLRFHWPNDWPSSRLRLVTVTGPEARARQRDAIRWIEIDYVPDDATQPEASLFSVAVLRRSDWLSQSAQPGSVRGVEVATGRDHVAVATLEPMNPYPPGSRDADIFEALMPSLADISRIVGIDEPQ